MKQPLSYQVTFKERLYFFLLAGISFVLYATTIIWGRKLIALLNLVGRLLGNQLVYTIKIIMVVYVCITIFVALFLAPLLLMGHILGNAVKVSPQQFPGVFDIVQRQSQQLGLKKAPSVYIIDGHGIFQAFAIWFAFRNYVVLFSRVVHSVYQEGGDTKTLEFIVGHELGHIKRGHTGLLKTIAILPAATLFPLLRLAYARACEYTCDRIGYSLAPEGATTGAITLAVGERLAGQVSTEAYLASAKKDSGFATSLATILGTHPHVADRVKAIQELRKEL